jgi:energy-coupling factor transporter ATP-binding protein EcfA2
MTSEGSDDAAPALVRPALLFETITFCDGTTLTLDETDIVVFVGPNNTGKSHTLRELSGSLIRNDHLGKFVASTTVRKHGSADDLRKYLENNSYTTDEMFFGIGFSIESGYIRHFDTAVDRAEIASFFTKWLSTENRIHGSDAAPALPVYQSPATHPIHLMLMDDALAADICEKFRHAFGMDLTPLRAGGSKFPLYVGEKPTLKSGKDELSSEFVEALISTNSPLESQGDGMRSFVTVLLDVLSAKSHSTQFLDEPEAFLHPPQARLLGRYIAERRREKFQLFIATHSADILDGLIEGGSNRVRIVRLWWDGKLTRAKEFSKEQTRIIAKDTLTRFSRVFDGIFFQHVVICESDSDCMFYQSILNLSSISGERRPDVLFIHAAGKHRMAKLAETLRALDVPVSVICDIDILNEENVFRGLLEKLGGSWLDIHQHWKAVSDAVTSLRPSLTAGQVAAKIAEEIEGVTGTDKFPPCKETAIKQIFKKVSPWSAVKESGRAALPGGEPTRQFDALNEKCAALGLWIVPVGEMEGFCRSIGSHGPGFVEKVIEERNLETDEELKEAREFIGKLWKRARSNAAE